MQDVAFIKESMIGGVLAKGLAVVYEQKPEKPIDYLAKWLLNYSEMSKKKNALLQKEAQEQQILKAYDARYNEEQKAKTDLQKCQQEKQEKEDKFIQKLHEDEYFLENLQEHIPNYIFEKLNITAAYIGIFDYPNLEIDVNNDDFNAHKNLQVQQTFQYIGASDDHKFMLQQNPPQNFLTNKLFQLGDDQDPFNEFIFIPDVTQQKDIHFYRIPKLGSYMALPLFLKNYFTEAIFDNSLEQRINYLKNLENYQNELENLQKTFESKKAAADPETEDIAAIDAELNQQLEALVKPECPQFQFEIKKYVICIDTLSKDTQIDVHDKKYLINFSKQIKEKWEQVQMNILENDIQAQLKYLKSVNVPAEYVNQDELSEQQNIEQKFKFYQEQLLSDEITEYFNVFFSFRTIKFQGVLQSVLYLLGYTKDQVNEKGTNLLEWKQFQKNINFEMVKKAAQYDYTGAKPAEVPQYAKIQRLQQRQEDLEVIQNYNQGLAVLYKWLQLALQLRIADVIKRQKEQQESKENRNLLIQQFEELKEKKEVALNAHKDSLQGEDLENFDQAAWETEFDTNNPPIEVGDEIVDDIDNDVDKIVEEQQ